MKITSITNTYRPITFGKQKNSKKILGLRMKTLQSKGVSPTFSYIIAKLNTNQYRRALVFLKNGVKESYVEEIANFNRKKYKNTLTLIQKGVRDSYLFDLANLERDNFEEAISYLSKGFDDDCIKLYTDLTDQQKETAIEFLNNGFTPLAAGNLAVLSEIEREKALYFLTQGLTIKNACQIAKEDNSIGEKCDEYLKQGIEEDFVCEIAKLQGSAEKRVHELRNLKVGDINISTLASLDENDYKRALELIKQGVCPNYIADIVDIENGKESNSEYQEYKERGYSYTTSFALSLLDDNEIKIFKKLREMHPEIRDLMTEEYDFEIIELQNNDAQDIIFTKQFVNNSDTKIKLIQTFDSYGDSTKSRTEEYKDNSTTSYMKKNSNIFKTKYDKHGEIKEMTEYIREGENITAVINTKASPILKGAFDSVYYDISMFKEDSELDSNNIDKNIEDSVKSKGDTISQVIQKEDGTIEYTESYQFNEFKIDRQYSENKDEKGNIKGYSYRYRIENEDTNTVIMDINRSFEKISDNLAINIINGNKYTIEYNDNEKTAVISDGNKEKILEFSKKLPLYSEKIIWNAIKQLPADTILTIHDNISKWHYCENIDSAIQPTNAILSSGMNQSIIEHETGHINTNQNKSILENNELYQIYGNEMDRFLKNIPYNEQEFIHYLSPRAEIEDAEGFMEFIAETNILLTSYGTKYNKLTTRAFFLSKYFPESIAKIAELTGKNSKESILK